MLAAVVGGATWFGVAAADRLLFQEPLDPWPNSPPEWLMRAVLSALCAAFAYWIYRAVCKIKQISRQKDRAARIGDMARASSDLAARILLFSDEAIMVTDAQGRIVEVNPAFSRITGYHRSEVLGANPRLMKSGRHDTAFYEGMWRELTEGGQWTGEIWDRRKDGSEFPKWLTINAVYRNGRIQNYLAIFRDLSEIKHKEQRIRQLAFHDPLTRLPNRSFLEERVHERIAAATRAGTKFALLFIDLDRFKYVNDTLGHAVGDELLVEMAGRIRACMDPEDLVIRLGGDEFIVLTADIGNMEQPAAMARKILAAIRPIARIRDYEFHPGASIGISIFPDDAQDLDALLRHSDAAMYKTKEAGGNGFHFYTEALNLKAEHYLFLLSSLPAALSRKEFTIHYQPQADLHTGQLSGIEALLRWSHPRQGEIAPGEFIPVCEETGLILPLGRWVLEQACRSLSQCEFAGAENLRMGVNISPRQIHDTLFLKTLALTLEAHRLDPARLELEFTESLLVRDEPIAKDFLRELKAIGVRIALDDFGTGYSSLGYLSRYEFDVLKIDRSFIGRVQESEKTRKLIASILALAHNIGMEVTVEGVETIEQLELLREMGADTYQGYLLGRPMPARECETFLETAATTARDFYR